jgi:hypothetical protein
MNLPVGLTERGRLFLFLCSARSDKPSRRGRGFITSAGVTLDGKFEEKERTEKDSGRRLLIFSLWVGRNFDEIQCVLRRGDHCVQGAEPFVNKRLGEPTLELQ